MFLKRVRLSSLHRLFSSPNPEPFLSRSDSLPMAQNRQDEAESESLESSDREEEEEDSESEKENTPKPLFSKKVEITGKSSESLISKEDPEDEEDEGASEEEEDDEAPPVIKPENFPSANPPARSNAASKRAASEREGVGDRDDDAKRSKKKKSGEETKKSAFQRVFSEGDEIVILEGLIEYRANTGVDPGSNLNGFRDFVNKSLPFETTKTQLYEKIRGLRKRYENNSKKGRCTFNTTHEKNTFELSKKIWGIVEANAAVEVHNSVFGGAKTKGKKKEIGYTKAGVLTLDACLRNVNMSAEEMVMNHGLDIVDEATKIELQEKWKQYRIEEMKLHLKKLKFFSKEGKLVLKSMESTD